MRTKRLRSLQLNKETVRALDTKEMIEVAGGAPSSPYMRCSVNTNGCRSFFICSELDSCRGLC